MGSRRNCHCKYEPKIHTTFALFLMMMGCLLLAIFATRAIPSHTYTKHFVETTCTVESTQIAANVCCEATVTSLGSCAEGYTYPCAEVEVTYTKDGGGSSTAMLFDEHESMAFTSAIDKCSYFHCFAATYEKHLSLAEEFLEEYGHVGDQHPCYYDPSNEDTAVLHITSTADLLHAILWPMMLILISTIIFIIVIVIRKNRLDLLDEDEEEDDSSEDTKSIKSGDVTTALTYASRTSSETSMLAPPQRDEMTPASPERWAQDPESKSSGSSTRPTTRSAIQFDLETPTEEKGKKKNNKNTKKTGSRKDSKILKLTPVNP